MVSELFSGSTCSVSTPTIEVNCVVDGVSLELLAVYKKKIYKPVCIYVKELYKDLQSLIKAVDKSRLISSTVYKGDVDRSLRF